MRLLLLATTAAALCWPADETDASRPLFWLHAPKTGSSLREFLECFPFVGLQERWGESISAQK